jgi:MFS family permease
MTLSSYFIGISAGQLLYGPLLDRFGRKKPLFIGLLVYILASLGCVFVTDIDTFIGLRFVQAIGAVQRPLHRYMFETYFLSKIFQSVFIIDAGCRAFANVSANNCWRLCH